MHGQSESKFRLRRGSIYRRLCIHLSLVVRASMPFFFSLFFPPPLFFRIDQKMSLSHTRPLYIRFASNSISFLSIHPSPHRSSIHTRQFTTLVDNVAINIAITIACSSHRWPARFLWPPFNFIRSREEVKEEEDSSRARGRMSISFAHRNHDPIRYHFHSSELHSAPFRSYL